MSEERALTLSKEKETNVCVRLASLDDVAELSQIIIDAGWVKPGTKLPDVMVRVLKGQEVGLPAIEAVNTIAVINGKPSLYGDGQLAIVMSSGLLEDKDEHFEKAEDGSTVAVCTTKRRGMKTPHTTRFGWADAKRAGLANKPGPWTQNPARQCQMRARAFNLRDMFPDVLCGIYSGEEAEDIPSEGYASEASESAPLSPPSPRRNQRKAAAAPKPVDLEEGPVSVSAVPVDPLPEDGAPFGDESPADDGAPAPTQEPVNDEDMVI